MKFLTLLLSILLYCGPTIAATVGSCEPKQERQRLGIPDLKITPINEARIFNAPLSDGRLRITIFHEIIHGISLDQMDWWFRNMANSLPSQVTECKPYILLDDDHVSIDAFDTGINGVLQVGSSIQFVDQDFYISAIEPGHLVFQKYMFGVLVLEIDRSYQETRGGILLTTTLTAGIKDAWPFVNDSLLAWFFNQDMQEAWKHHTTQEMGAIETLLPWLIRHWEL